MCPGDIGRGRCCRAPGAAGEAAPRPYTGWPECPRSDIRTPRSVVSPPSHRSQLLPAPSARRTDPQSPRTHHRVTGIVGTAVVCSSGRPRRATSGRRTASPHQLNGAAPRPASLSHANATALVERATTSHRSRSGNAVVRLVRLARSVAAGRRAPCARSARTQLCPTETAAPAQRRCSATPLIQTHAGGGP
jgi:hypothetical protein